MEAVELEELSITCARMRSYPIFIGKGCSLNAETETMRTLGHTNVAQE